MTALLAVTTTVLGTAAPAQAAWTRAGDVTHYKICRRATPSGKGWQFVSRVHKRYDDSRARAGVAVRHEGKRRGKWTSGWLGDDEVAHGVVRIQRARHVRVRVWQEAGDPSSPLGTAKTVTRYRPRQIRHC